MAILVDASVIIGGEKGGFDLHGWLAGYPDEELELAAVTVAELWQGVERASGKRRLTRESYLSAILSALRVVPYTAVTALEHARLWARLQSAGTMIGDYDLIVAATALERGSAVATFDRRHFDSVPGLQVIEPE